MLQADRSAAVSADAFRAGMRKLPQPVCIVTTEHHGRRYGFVAGSVSSVSIEPPTLLVSIDRQGSTHDPLIAAGKFCLNVLAARDRAMAERFMSPAHRESRFALGTWTTMNHSPVLATAEAAFDCAVVERMAYHSHSIVLGLVQAVWRGDGPADPLIYVDRAFRRSA